MAMDGSVSMSDHLLSLCVRAKTACVLPVREMRAELELLLGSAKEQDCQGEGTKRDPTTSVKFLTKSWMLIQKDRLLSALCVSGPNL
mmetsp:Transcript_55189/g.124602  ORF Transcript_55189/g.124602 Transcript_55189/m.124602 type:complete len:87 (+) Transcript_55189:20-280(+)